MSKTEWGCPDWRNDSAYPKAYEDQPEHWWQWQFLRRSPEYRKAWQDFEDTGQIAPRFAMFGSCGLPAPSASKLMPRLIPEYSQPAFSFTYTFDLSRPRKKQFTDAMRKVKAQQASMRRVTRLWPRYLRILDAVDARERGEATDAEIARKFRLVKPGGESEYETNTAAARVKQAHNAAMEVINRLPIGKK